VADSSQKRALKNYRERLGKRGLARFEILGVEGDRDLIRLLARRLASNDREAMRLRAEFGRLVGCEPPRRGGLVGALRRSPLVGADLEFSRDRDKGREIDL